MLISKIVDLKRFLKSATSGNKTIGLVPTMGFLHEGHLSLIRRAKTENDLVVVTIFVNPTQFGPSDDFETYPRNMEADTKLAQEAGADVIFHPSVNEMYPAGSSTWVNVDGGITTILCGASRPTHFKGVTTVVTMLFNIVESNRAYFGQKDAQQAAILKKMVQDLHLNVEIITCPIVREADGIALSSRNSYLNKDERQQATVLYKSLQIAQKSFLNGQSNVDELEALIKKQISEMPLAEIDYVDIRSFPSLDKTEVIKERAIAAVAVKFGKTRLIDNVILEKAQ